MLARNLVVRSSASVSYCLSYYNHFYNYYSPHYKWEKMHKRRLLPQHGSIHTYTT